MMNEENKETGIIMADTTYLHFQVEINDCAKVDADVSAASFDHKSTLSFLLDGKEYRISAVELRDMLQGEHEYTGGPCISDLGSDANIGFDQGCIRPKGHGEVILKGGREVRQDGGVLNRLDQLEIAERFNDECG